MADISFEFAGVFSGAGDDVLANPTSLQFGPDGRLYVTEQTGSIKAFTVEEQNGTWVATQSETLVDANGDELVRSIQNHFDDGSLKDDSDRQVTGIKVLGTEEEPVLYITSSDPSISFGGEINLDTNSGVLSKATYDNDTGEWSVVDLVRGLPRSEENHAVNGLEVSADETTLLLQVGGATNNGASSNFFSYANEYALGGSVLEIDLAALDAMPVLVDNDGGQNGTARDYVYDLPTLDDPNIENVTDGVGEDAFGMDEDGPFGGNDGLNQAILPADAPLSIFATGLRNAYDIIETPNGNVFTVDNGSNSNLGGAPNTENGDPDGDGISNEFIAGTNTTPLGEAEPIFQIVEGGHYYHANPLLSNQNQSWTVYDNDGNPDENVAVNYVEDISTLVPAGVAIAEGYLVDPSKIAYSEGVTLADVSEQEAQARLELAGVKIDRDTIIQDDPDGDGQGQQVIATVGSSTNGLVAYDSNGQAFGGVLDGKLITAQFNGNVTLLNISDDGTTLEPIYNSGADGIFGTDDDEVQDEDGILALANSGTAAPLTVPLDVTVGPDGTLWIAEIGTGEITVVRPSDGIAEVNTDADGDGIANVDDLFVRDADNGTGVELSGNQTVLWDFDANQDGNRPGTDGFGGGLTGVQSNGVTDYEAFFQFSSALEGQDVNLDNVKFITAAGGGTTVIENVSNGDAIGNDNTGQFLFHTGLIADETVETLNFNWVVVNPGDSLSGGYQQIGGYIGTGDQDNYLKVVASAAQEGSINVVLEIDGVVVEDVYYPADGLLDVPAEEGLDINIDLHVDVVTGIATPTISYENVQGGTVTVETDGFDISDSIIMNALLGEHEVEGQESGLAVGLYSTNNGAAEADTFQAVFKDLEVTSTGVEGDVIYRVNAGGEAIVATDGGPDWSADTVANRSVNLVDAGSGGNATFDVIANSNVSEDVPDAIFETERWDAAGGSEMEYAFDVEDGTYLVHLYMGNGYSGTSETGERVFDVSIEGDVSADFDDIDLIELFGHQQGGVISEVVEVTDGELNIEFLHGVENPMINGIEIAQLSTTDTSELIEVSIVTDDQSVSESEGSVNVSILTDTTVPIGESVELEFTIQGVSAIAGSDYEPATSLNGSGSPVFTGTATIPGGSSDFQLSIDILDDALIEGSEELLVTLTGVSDGATIGNASTSITILDNDGANAEVLEIFEGLNDVDDDGLYAVDDKGGAVLTILDGVENPQSSNFGNNSFQLTNTGGKEIAAVVIDFRSAVFGDSVVDSDGSGGDSTAKPFNVNSEGGTGGFISQSDAYLFDGDDPLPNTTGTGLESSGGYEGLLVKFDGTGFTNGETVGFSGDMDPNSIAGLNKNGANGVDTNATNDWDVGGISGSELIGSTFTVYFDDGTTAQGYLHSDQSQSGSIGEAVEGAAPSVVELTVDTQFGELSQGDAGSYGATAPIVSLGGTPGDTVRVVLQKGFNPVENDNNGIADLVADRLADDHPDFLASNSFDLQTYDVVIPASGLVTLPTDAFDYNGTQSGVEFEGSDTAPLAFTAAVIGPVSDNSPDVLNGDTQVAMGPVTEPIYLTSNGTPVGEVEPVELILNGDFEDHAPLTNANGTWDLFDEVEGWNATTGNVELQEGVQFAPGNTVAELDARGNSVIEQVVDVQDAGVYTFSMDHAARGGAIDGSSDFEVRVNGETVATIANTDTEFSTTEVGLGLDEGVAVIELVALGQSDGRGALIDNVSLQQVSSDAGDLAVTSIAGIPTLPIDELAAATANDEEDAQEAAFIL